MEKMVFGVCVEAEDTAFPHKQVLQAFLKKGEKNWTEAKNEKGGQE